VTYCDTSFVAALYLPDEIFEPQARTISAKFDRGIPYPWLLELELCNTVYRGLGRNLYDKRTCTAILAQIAADKNAGILSVWSIDTAALFRNAMELSKRFTAAHSSRTLDILHVAAALEFRADTIASFDQRQRKLAAGAGLNLLPPSP
jgi:predicted nucleic acid-binding protein